MSTRPLHWLTRAWPAVARVVRLAAVPLAIGAVSGCERTTSLGRAAAPTDARVEQHDSPSDRPGDRGADDGSAEHQPQVDARPDAAMDLGPIVGGDHDATSDGGDGGDDGADDGALPDAAID